MPHTTQTSDFWGWYLRHNDRVIWRYMSDAGVDTFATGPNNNTNAFLDLTNVLPAMSGGFYPRWGLRGLGPVSVSPVINPVVRTFFYNVPQDASNPTHTIIQNLILGTDNKNWVVVNDGFTTHAGFVPSSFSSSIGIAGAVTSRNWFYYGNGIDPARKVNMGYTASNTDSLNGIAIPVSGSATNYSSYPSVIGPNTSTLLPVTRYGESTGYGYTSPPTVTVTDPTGAGSGCTVSCSIGVHGEVNGFAITNPGSGYVQANATLSAPPSGGVQASLVLYVQTNPSAPHSGTVVNGDFGGQMQFIAGRQYAVALQNSITGHTSDVYITNLPFFPKSGITIDALTNAYTAAQLATGTTIPIYSASANATAGYTQLELVISVPAAGLDPQVDTVLLLATSDGGGLGTLYQVNTFPLSSFTLISGFYQLYYVDGLPDSYDDQNTTGNTLLEADLWAFTDSAGDTFGILLNTPPTPAGFLYPTQHQGRMFATDGKTVFFSKSLDEVTTSTGVITSKWEECWPGDYQLPIALNNETIVGLKSDGTNLHIGTDKSIYTLYGSDPSSFSVPAVAFAQTGVMSNDLWTVIFVEGQPAGFCWLTPDFKVIYSDFSTYNEIGTSIYPHLQQFSSNGPSIMTSLTQGPYNFVVLQFQANSPATTGTSPYWFNFVDAPYNSISPVYWLWETRLKKWYRWLTPGYDSTFSTGAAFVYQAPGNSSAWAPGVRHLFYWQSNGSSAQTRYFDPFAASDAALAAFDSGHNGAFYWNVQTSWQDCGDSTAIKVADEIELTSDNTNSLLIPAPPIVTLYGATSESQFLTGGVLLKSAQAISGPLASLNTLKMYCAGSPTAAKYYSVQIGGIYGGHSANDPITPVLSSFSLEQYPMARI